MSNYRRIPLSGNRGAGMFALVDEEDFELVSGYTWYLSASGYALAHVKGSKPYRSVFMHNLVMKPPEGFITDHKFHQTLDNRKGELRIVSKQQNHFNSKSRRGSSKYKGVSWFQPVKKWRAYIRRDGKQFSLGYFDDEIEAAKAYDARAKELFGEFASLNFP